MEPYSRRKNTYLQNIGFIKNYFQAFVTPIPIYLVTQLEKIEKSFLWENSTSKSKHDTLCNNYKHGLKKIWKRIESLQCSWTKRL